jgi:fatty acid desaturase
MLLCLSLANLPIARQNKGMDHKSLVQHLPPDLRADLTQTSDRAGLLHLAGHLGALGVSCAIILATPPLWWLVLPVQGILLVFLFTLEHEATHKTPFASLWLNKAAGRICGLILLLPFEWFRYFHLAHHRYTNQDGLDPELASTKPTTAAGWALHISGLPYWASQIRLILALAFLRPVDTSYLPQPALPHIRREAQILLGLYEIAFISLFVSPVLFWLWIFPVLLGQPFLRLYLLAEHGDCPRVANMLENTRTTFTNRIVRFIAWNMPYHAEHHTYPAVPFHNLPRFHGIAREFLQVTSAGYVAFTKDYLARRLPGR